jgi:hypothetical protein
MLSGLLIDAEDEATPPTVTGLIFSFEIGDFIK